MVATKIRSDMKETQEHMSYEGLDEGHARSVIPDSLYMLLQLLIAETSESEMDDINTSITRVLSISQDQRPDQSYQIKDHGTIVSCQRPHYQL